MATKSLALSVTDRSRGIGGSDVGAIFGLSKWGNVPKLWLQKTGRLFNQESTDNEFQDWGRYLEAPIAKKYSEKTGRSIRRPSATLVHPEYPWMIGNPDRFQKDGTKEKARQRGVLEVKTAMFGKLREWSQGGVPAGYYLQLQHYLSITGLDWGSFAVLFGGNKLVEFDVPRDEKLIALMIEKEREFWGYVQRDEPPAMQLGAEWNAQLVNFFPKPKQTEALRLDSPEAQGKALRLIRLKQQIKKREPEIEELESWFKLQMADHATARVAKLATISWSPGEQKRVNLDKLREKYTDIAQELTESKPTRRFSVRLLADLPEEEEEEERSDSTLIVSARRIELD